MTNENLEFLFNFYIKLNEINKNKVDLDKFKKENGVYYSFNEDVVEEIQESLKELDDVIEVLKKNDLEEGLQNLLFQYDFFTNFVKLNSIFGRLSITFGDFRDFDTAISKSLPEGPKDDSELIH